jgi:uncharacterized protein YndB with AHSA1/START domain
VTATAGVEVTVHVAATPETVFPYFTDPARYVQWMGSQAELDPVPGGTYRVRTSDGFQAAGTFIQIEPPHQLAFTWGFADDAAAKHVKHERTEASSGSAMPAGSTRVTVTFDAEGGGTRVTLRHDDLPNDELREGHRVAWQTYLPRLAIRAAGGDPGPDPHA